MARKYDLIMELYNRTCESVVSSPGNWQAFLSSACRNYKLRFDEQLLVYAQRPDATAVLELERWNSIFGRWVNRGATGIAVFEDENRGRQRLIHYFDVSDTHESRYSRPVPIWSMKPEYEEEVIETLEGTFGELKDKSSLASAILSAAQNATEDNAPDYTSDLMHYVDGSLLVDFSENNVSSLFKKLVSNSVAFMIMQRLDIDAKSYFEWEDLADVAAFSTPETLNSLGLATSDIAEMGLAEIAKTVMSLDKQNRIIAENQKSDYNIDKEIFTERSSENERIDLHDAGRLQTAEPDLTGAAGSTDGALLSNEENVPEGASQSDLLQSSDELQAERASERGTGDSDRDGGTSAQGNGVEGGGNGRTEGQRHDGVGSEDEQHPQQSAGSGVEASSLRLDYYDRRFEDKSLPFFGGDDTIRELLATTPHLKASKDEIRAFYESETDNDKRTEFIKGIFNNDYTEVILSDERRVGYKSYQNVLHLWEGRYPDRTKQSFYDWGVIARYFEAMRLFGELQDKIKPLPSIEGQMNLILDYEAEVRKPSAFVFSQEIIDAILTHGSGVSGGKMRIYEQFQKSLSKKENADFLKEEYGWGGAYPVITGTDISEDHNAKGIRISKGIGEDKPHIDLKWSDVERRIGELIKMDRYLNSKEKEHYPDWLARQEIIRAEAEEKRRAREILSVSPAEKEQEQPSEAVYEYHLGDTVYIGAHEYEILSFDDERVMLFDAQFPLLNEEMSRAEFDQKVRENPMNDHLKALDKHDPIETAAAGSEEPTPHFDSNEFEKLIPYGMRFKQNNIVNGNEMYWVTQGIFNLEDLRVFQQAVRDYNSNIKKFYVTSRSISPSYSFESDTEDKVLAIVTPDAILADDYFRAIQEEGLGEYLAPENEEEVSAESRYTPLYDSYLEVKNDNPDHIVLYQVGDFFEAYNEDAENVAQALDLTMTSRSVSENQRVPMVGFPRHRLETYTTMLTDRGNDVTVSAVEGEERRTYSIASMNKEDPVESKPIGRIDYLHTDGRVRESIEYTSSYQFVKDIKEENQYGVPMSIVFYADNEGHTIDRDFLASLDPPAQGVKVILSPYIKKPLAARIVDFYKDYDYYDYWDSLEVGDTDEDAIERVNNELDSQSTVNSLIIGLSEILTDEGLSDEQKAEAQSLIDELNALRRESPTLATAKQLIDEYCREEFEQEEGADYSDLSKVGVAYTTTEDGKHEIQANVNLIDFQIETLVDGKVIRGEQFSTLEDMIERGLKNLSFNELVYLSGEELERVEQSSAPVIPAWEQPKKSKVQSFDLHPEIPMADRHNFNLAEHEIEEVGKKERFRRNMEAIKVLKECESENRFATPDEQIILSKYVGWGGIPEAFDEGNTAWANEFLELSAALSSSEYASARESTLTAFYTPPTVIKAVYKALEQMGFREGNMLDPSCGIGHFIGMLPDSMKDSKIYGVELDSISARIAQQLYQKTSIAEQPFEETNLPDSFFDAVVGNVPFGDFKVPDKRYDKYKFLIHDYFFAKSLDKLRPGGVMALITSKGTMDKENPAVRKYIAQRADLIGAIRLPNDTFKGNAGTEVVSDIIILQKRDRLIDIEPEWVHLGKDENGNTMNSYFIEHPEMILGEMKTVSGRFGPELSCLPYEGADLAEQLNEAITNIHGEISEYEADEELAEEDNSIPADPTVRNFSYTVLDDKVYFRENSRMTPVDVSATAESRIKGMISIRDSVRYLIELQTEDYPDSFINAEQEHLNSLYDTFTSKYGLINSRANTSAFSQDSSFSLLSALEILDDEGNLERKADMFFKRTIKPHTPVTSVDTSSEALAVSIGEKACIDMDYMMQLSGKTEEELEQDLAGVIFRNIQCAEEAADIPRAFVDISRFPFVTADEYLSGNVRQKLRMARAMYEILPAEKKEQVRINVEALEKVQPKDLTASEISVRLGATWLPTEIVEQFIYEFLGTPRYAQWNIKLHFSEYTGEWNLEGKTYDRGNVKAYSTYGTSRINAYKIIEETLNLKDVRIFDYVEDEYGKKKAVLNKKETAIAQSKQELIKQGFQDWIWSDPQRRERLTKLYNEKFNSIRPREYDGSHITFNGMNPEIELREHQRNAVAHILYGGNTLLAHAVGAGKTFEMTAAAMESKRLGLCSKSLFVVPNHLTEQWAAEFLQLYPSANILVATKKDFETKNRKRFCGRIATGDYDAIIIGHSQFEKIPMSIERQRAILEQQLDEITEGIADLKRNRGDNFSVKQLERTKKSVKAKLDKLNDQSRKDDVVTFEELGVDRLFIDESHYYKNLFLYTKMRNVGGIAQTEAQKSSDLFMKCRYLDEITGGRGTVFATGTPISNSMVELYTIQRYLQYSTLAKNNLQHFDAWASTFGETVTAVELTPEGTGYRAKTRFARFYNLPELMAMFKEVADIKTADMLDLPVPKANFHNVAVKPSEIQTDMVASLSERAERVRNGMVDASVDNMLKITNDGRKLALDQRLMNEMLPDHEGSKLNACVENVYQTWKENSDTKAAQLIFCDMSTPKADGTFSVYDDIRKKLIERGIPAEEIKFIHEADTEAKKLELFKKTRKGEVRVLMGSTQKMGAGTNVQNKLIALHDLDCPWRPSDLEQRLGRIVRQGNENPQVEIYRYVTEQTFDAYLYQLVEGKQKFASQIMTSKSPVRSCEDIDETALSYAEIKMLATGNPYIKEKMDLDIQVQKLRLLKSNFLSEKYALEDKIIKFFPQEIAKLTARIEGLKSDIERVSQHPKPIDDTFVGMTVKGVFYSEKADAGKAIIEACRLMTNPEPVLIGEYRGFQMELSFDTYKREYEVKLKGELGHTVPLGTDTFGNITRLDNTLEGLTKRLEVNVQALENTKEQFEVAKVDVDKPFSQEEELKAKTARLSELNALLNVDKRENEIVDGEPDEGDDAATQRKEKSHER